MENLHVWSGTFARINSSKSCIFCFEGKNDLYIGQIIKIKELSFPDKKLTHRFCIRIVDDLTVIPALAGFEDMVQVYVSD